jgi:hypothetical protein
LNREERERVIHSEKYSDGSNNELTFVHIGKCGGYTITDALAVSPKIQNRFKNIKRIHIRRPYYQRNAQYLFVLRNPIDRLISAFAWRYKKVVAEKQQEFRYAGEYEILKKYRNLNNLAEKLIQNGEISISTVKELSFITHFQQDISYYLDPLLPYIRKNQIYSVFTQETLDFDIQNTLKAQLMIRRNNNKLSDLRDRTELTDLARHNLKIIFARDYECIQLLDKIYPIGTSKMDTLIRSQ